MKTTKTHVLRLKNGEVIRAAAPSAPNEIVLLTSGYQDTFWSKRIRTKRGNVPVTYMLGFSANFVLFWSKDTFIIRFMGEFDLDVDKLVREVDKLRIATTSD